MEFVRSRQGYGTRGTVNPTAERMCAPNWESVADVPWRRGSNLQLTECTSSMLTSRRTHETVLKILKVEVDVGGGMLEGRRSGGELL